MVLEGSDQHRGWFQTSLVTAVALRGAAPFRKVLTHGFVVDGQGRKMSKSQGNVVSPQEVMKTAGADVLRLWVSSCDTDTDVRLSPEILERMAEAYRKIRNTFRYLLGNLADFDPARGRVAFEKMDSIDRWALTRLRQVAQEVTQCYEEFRFHRIYQVIYDFCITDLSAFYLDVLKDRLYTKRPQDPLRRSSQTAFFILAKALSQLLAPVLAFTADEVWTSFAFGPEKSVHESLWDSGLWQHEDRRSLEEWNAIRELRRASDLEIERLREAKEIGSSLECRLILKPGTKDAVEYLSARLPELKLGCIVSEVSLADRLEGGVSFQWQFPHPDGRVREAAVELEVKRARGKKCARCWKYSEQVGAFEDPALCEECAPVEKTAHESPRESPDESH
jgi:isoleucyl-tRNA synthetase